ncbi:MAG TPA: HAMP domain-containing sensor histidine kinase [Lentimicrobium sp.]|nr:HAMP domain-containing sensor histidine kinase [Lentimicrobium sp.]
MRKRAITIIISLAAFALIGIIAIQFYWMRNALQLQKELIDKKVNVTLRSVVNRLFDERQITGQMPFVCGPGCDRRTREILAVINPDRIDSLLHQEFDASELTHEHVWGIYDPVSAKFLAGENTNKRNQLFKAGHRVSLSCLYNTEQISLIVYFPNEKEKLLVQLLPWLLISLLLVGIVVFAFSFMIFSFLKQKKLSELKSDFVNNMTHELKTPISTISLASEMLLNPKSILSDEKTRKYARMIFDENQRMQKQVEQVLQIAVLEKGAFKIELSTFDAHAVINQCISRFELSLKNLNGDIKFYPEATDYFINADQIHFQNIVCNLLDNALKYTKNEPEITIRTTNKNGYFNLMVSDNGIGISDEEQKMIFDKLYRVPTGNLHDVKGFGLGLFYVKTITEALKGEVTVKSTPHKGSTFEICLPLNVNAEAYG